MLEHDKKDPLVIGGGLAGLTAARFLKKNGLNPLVLEAEDKLGGRIQTERMNGFEIETGGEFVGADHREMQQLCRELGLKLVPHKFNPAFKVGEHEFLEGDRLSNHFRHLNDLVKSAPQPDEYLASISFLEFLRELEVTEDELTVQRIIGRFSYARDISSQSALSVIRDLREGVSAKEDSLWIKGGNDQLINQLAEIIGKGAIRLNSKVKTINQGEEGVEVSCADGTTYKSNCVIVALPTHAVSSIEFMPQLPKEKRAALKAVSYTKVVKMSALFPTRCWGDDFELLQNGNPDALYYASQGQDGESAVLIAYAIHEHASELIDSDEIDQRKLVHHLLVERFSSQGISVPHPTKTKIYPWPHAFSSYDRGNYYDIVRELNKPYGLIYLAGEQQPPEFKDQGYFEGAVVSGRVTAEQILNLRT